MLRNRCSFAVPLLRFGAGGQPRHAATTPSPFPILSTADVNSRLLARRPAERFPFYAMYSSYLGGIVTTPDLMMIPLDDHMCHRGHAVFDTATIADGHLYRFDIHADRFLRSARGARINHNFTKEHIKEVVVATARAAKQPFSSIRMWMTAGPGDLSISPAGCVEPCFYCIATNFIPMPSPDVPIVEASVSTLDVGLKVAPVGTLKSSNYLANVLLYMQAKDRGGYWGVWVAPAPGVADPVAAHEEGLVKEGPVNAFIIVKQDGSVLAPPADDVLLSCTATRVLEIARAEGRSASFAPFRLRDVFEAREAMFAGGDNHVMGVGTLDGRRIGDGTTGPFTRRAMAAIDAECRVAGPYSEKIF